MPSIRTGGSTLRRSAFVVLGWLAAVGAAPAAAETACPGWPAPSVAAALPVAAARIAAKQPVRVLAIGSSTTAGVGSFLSPSYPEVKATTLRRLFPDVEIALTQAGSSGETARGSVERLAFHIESRPFDIVVWQVGTNDYLFGRGLRDPLRQGLDLLRKAGIDAVLVDQQHYPGIRDLPLYERLVAEIEEAGREYGALVVSRYWWMKAVAAQEPRVNLLAFDRFHNNGLGHRCLGEGVAKAIFAAITAPPPANGSGPPAANGAPAPAGTPVPVVPTPPPRRSDLR